MATLAGRLDWLLRQSGIPLAGVTVGAEADRATWRAQYEPSATGPQRSQGDQILATVDPNDGPTFAALVTQEVAADYDSDKKLQAVAVALWECIPAPLMTKAQLRARVIAILRTL